MRLQPDIDIRQPLLELFGTAAVHRWERTDHAIAACSYHKLDARDEKHRRRDQRQAEAVVKARQSIGWLRHVGLSRVLFVLALPPTLARAKANYKTGGRERMSNPLYAFPA